MISRVTFAIHWMIPVAVELLFPVDDSMLVVLIFAVFTKVYHEASKLVSVQVRMNVPPLPAGSVPSISEVTGILIFAGAISERTTPDAILPQLFP